MQKQFLFITIVAFLLLCSNVMQAQDDMIAEMSKSLTSKPHLFGSTEERYLVSKETNSTYTITVYLPPSYTDTQAIYPIMVMTDASLGMGIAQNTFECMTVFKEMREVILIGISNPFINALDWSRARFRDMTPTSVEGYQPSGSADKFITFIKNELFPYIENNYRIDTTDRCFSGVSLGGLLGSYILIEYPELFNHYIIGSPSYWWDDKAIAKRLSEKTKPLSGNIKTVYTFIGGNEGVHVTNWEEFNNILAGKLSEEVKISRKVFENETHMSTTPAALSTALKFVYGN